MCGLGAIHTMKQILSTLSTYADASSITPEPPRQHRCRSSFDPASAWRAAAKLKPPRLAVLTSTLIVIPCNSIMRDLRFLVQSEMDCMFYIDFYTRSLLFRGLFRVTAVHSNYGPSNGRFHGTPMPRIHCFGFDHFLTAYDS